ncbi:MAG: EamA family transporter [Patescibacteria group bacterium]|nr:EamA family transporter [Patescibacteria group bacterium]
MAYLSIVVAQFLYTMSDTWKKAILNASGFSAATLVKPVFLLAILVAGVGFLFQMHALSKIDLSRTIVFMGMLAVIFSSAAGVIFFREQLNTWNVIGLTFAVVAIILVNIK